ncbi:MAG: hypothetical protein QOG64_1575 [Acidimicrobiaceae bacterium]|nr:hypothetical protein [Acidimicrobiaceae bacterium]
MTALEDPTPTTTTTTFRTCPLCEATCGLEVVVRPDDHHVVRIRGDRQDVFSHGFLCPKGSTLKQLHEDPDRIRTPLVKRDGVFEPATWEEAFAEIERRLPPILGEHGRNSCAVYVGNPTAHNLSSMLYGRAVMRGVGSDYRYSASTVDQMPKQVSAGLMFGTAISVPVPDVDRTDYLLVMGANPFDSNGSLMTAPDIPGRLRALRARGGKLVVVDPRRSKTADEADEWVAIRPGTDAMLLLAMVHTLFEEGLAACGPAAPWITGTDEVRRLAEGFPPEVVAEACGITAGDIRRLARELAAAPRAAVYGRIGTCTQEFGTLASWLIDVVNTLTGNLDQPGGAMFPKPAAGSPNTEGASGTGRGLSLQSRKRTRVRSLPAVLGEFPVATLAEEIDTPGADGERIRAVITLAGNPVASTQNSERLDAALATLDFMVAVDIYVNETTRHADVILPAPSPMARGHFDVLLYRLAIRNVANYSPATFDLDPGERHEWETLLRLGAIAGGMTAPADASVLDDAMISAMVQSQIAAPGSPIEGRDPDEILAELAGRDGPERVLDLLLRVGPYGDGFGKNPGGLTLAELEANPHGVDLGPLAPRLPEVLRTPSGLVELAPPELLADAERLRAAIGRFSNGGMVLVGRRDLRSNNSWMHNIDVLVKGKARCTLQLNPADAGRLGLADGDCARVSSRVGSVEIPVEVTDGIMQGVVSIPHGWGHDRPGIAMQVAERRPGVNSNILADESVVDPLSGNGVLNGIPVEVAPAP